MSSTSRGSIRETLIEQYGDDELLFADGFDSCIIGVGVRCGKPNLVVYNRSAAIALLMKRDKMSMDEAEEFMDFNVIGAYVGERTPVWVTPLGRIR